MPESEPRWKIIADRLEVEFAGPTPAQNELADKIGMTLPTVPAQVAAALIREHLSQELFEPVAGPAADLEKLNQLESELGLEPTTELISGTRAERTARLMATYGFKTAQELRVLQPEVGDVVKSMSPTASFEREISSISVNGRIYLKGLPPKKSWPGYLEIVSRRDADDHETVMARVDAEQLNVVGRFGPTMAALRGLDAYRVDRQPTREAILELEDLLAHEAGERPYQQLFERHPSLLAATVAGGWQTFVIPQPRLGAEVIPDFLVLGVNSIGLQWLLVEIEAPQHRLLKRDGNLTEPVRHAVNQVNAWRRWLTTEVAYAQGTLGFHGLTNLAPGLVVIGRADDIGEGDPARSVSEENARIEIHTYDWILRNAEQLAADGRHFSDAEWNISS